MTKCCKYGLGIFESAKELEYIKRSAILNLEPKTKNDKSVRSVMDEMKDTEINSMKLKHEIQTKANDSVVESKDWIKPQITEELAPNVANEKPRTTI